MTQSDTEPDATRAGVYASEANLAHALTCAILNETLLDIGPADLVHALPINLAPEVLCWLESYTHHAPHVVALVTEVRDILFSAEVGQRVESAVLRFLRNAPANKGVTIQ